MIRRQGLNLLNNRDEVNLFVLSHVSILLISWAVFSHYDSFWIDHVIKWLINMHSIFKLTLNFSLKVTFSIQVK